MYREKGCHGFHNDILEAQFNSIPHEISGATNHWHILASCRTLQNCKPTIHVHMVRANRFSELLSS